MPDEWASLPIISTLSTRDSAAQQAKTKGNEVHSMMDYLFQTRVRSPDVDFHVARQRNQSNLCLGDKEREKVFSFLVKKKVSLNLMYAYFIFNAYPMTRALRLLKALSWIYFPFISCITNPFPRPTLVSPPSGGCACQAMTTSSQSASVVFPDVGFY